MMLHIWPPKSTILTIVICISLSVPILHIYYHVFADTFRVEPFSLTSQHGSNKPEPPNTQAVTFSFISRTSHGIPIYNSSASTSPPRFLSSSSPQTRPDPAPYHASTHSNNPNMNQHLHLNITTHHPRLFSSPLGASSSSNKWASLPHLIATDPYLYSWNQTIFALAAECLILPPPRYVVDGTSGVLDVAREVQRRIKLWAYAFRMSAEGGKGKMKWKRRIWEELVVAAGNGTGTGTGTGTGQGFDFGVQGDNWNSGHWLDVAEFLLAFSIAYDWLYDAWDSAEREAIRWSIVDLGLRKGLEAYQNDAWFLSVKGNWNCVTNGAMVIGSLAVYHEDPTNVSGQLLPQAIENAAKFCAQSVESDGTWVETPDYWYFGTQAHAQLASALLSATGSTHGMLTANPAFRETGMFHIYNYGMTDKFNYGDCGPVKLTATANALLFYGNEFNMPLYALYQRDRPDASDPLAMLWYNPHVTGSWYHDLPLDKVFADSQGAWVSMRSSWTDPLGIFAAMKAGRMVGHATHGNLDAGDFVLDAMGVRWAGELCQDDYSAPGYFSSEDQDSLRWTYYRCRTEGQNTIVYDGRNQRANATARTRFESSRADDQILESLDDGAFWIANLTEAYNGTHIWRGLRLLRGRKRLLLQDEILEAERGSQWRMHTNASIVYSNNGRLAHLALDGKTLDVLLASPSTASFYTAPAVRLVTDPRLPNDVQDMANEGISVLCIDIPAGNSTVAVVFCPRWEPASTCISTSIQVVPLQDWKLEIPIG